MNETQKYVIMMLNQYYALKDLIICSKQKDIITTAQMLIEFKKTEIELSERIINEVKNEKQ